MTDITVQQHRYNIRPDYSWVKQELHRQRRRVDRYSKLMGVKSDQYNIPTKDMDKEVRRLIRVARTINPRRHLRRVSYEIDPTYGDFGEVASRRVKIGPRASPFTIAHELGHLLPPEKRPTTWSMLKEEAKASRHAMRILQAAGYKGRALRRMQAQGMAAYGTHRAHWLDTDDAYAHILRNPIAHLFPTRKRKRARHLYNLVRRGRAQKLAALGKALT